MNSRNDILNSTDPSPATSTTNSFITDNDSESSISSKDRTLKRCQSDSSTTSTNEGGTASRFTSLDNIFSTKTNQLLKLSFLNSPNSPLHSSSRAALDGSLIDSVFSEAKKISEKLSSFNEMSFEDLNNISQHLVDSSVISMPDADLEQLKISFLENNPEIVPTNNVPSKSKPVENNEKGENKKIETIQEKLNRIKKETNEESEVKPELKPEIIEIKEDASDKKNDKEIDDIFQKIKLLMKDNKKDEAKKYLQKVNEMLGAPDPKYLQVQPMIRQDTFEIDQRTGKKKYLNSSTANERESNTNSELMDQLAKLFGAQSLDVGSLNLSNGGNNETKFVVIMPNVTPAATPVKQNIPSRRSVSFSSQRPSTAMKNIENKKLSTPMKPLTASTVRRSSFTAPRNVGINKQPHPYEQKLNIGTVRKSLMVSMDKSPSKSNATVSPKAKQPLRQPTSTTATNVRRSVSLKANIPSVRVSAPSPSKARPTTTSNAKISNVSRSNSSSTRRLSTIPSRPGTVADKGNLHVPNRPVTRKTEFKAPLSTSKISSTKESMV